MAGRRLLAVMLAALLMGILLAASGCTAGLDSLKRTKDGRLEYPVGNDVWSWGRTGSKIEVLFNSKPFAVIDRGQALVSLADGRTIDVALDGKGSPLSVKTNWGTILNQNDYTQMSTAFKLNQMAEGQKGTVAWGWIVVTLILLAAGVLSQIRAGAIVDWAKTGGIFSSFDTAKTLLIVRAVSVLLIVVGAFGLLAALF